MSLSRCSSADSLCDHKAETVAKRRGQELQSDAFAAAAASGAGFGGYDGLAGEVCGGLAVERERGCVPGETGEEWVRKVRMGFGGEGEYWRSCGMGIGG